MDWRHVGPCLPGAVLREEGGPGGEACQGGQRSPGQVPGGLPPEGLQQQLWVALLAPSSSHRSYKKCGQQAAFPGSIPRLGRVSNAFFETTPQACATLSCRGQSLGFLKSTLDHLKSGGNQLLCRCRRPVIGFQRDIEAFGRREVQDFFGRHYGPRNLTIAIVGDVDPSQVLIQKSRHQIMH